MVPSTSRRCFLAAAAASGTLTGTAEQTTTQPRPTSATTRPPRTIRLGGKLSGWTGRAPAAIRGQTNPTLALEPGRTYRLTWENIDGRQHNLALLDADGAVLERTSFVTERGATRTLTFTATREMVEYICEVHPNSMRGDIGIEGRETNTPRPSQPESRFMPWGPSVGLETVADGPLSAPLGFEVAPDDTHRRFVVDQVGQIYVHGPDGLETEPFLDITDRLVDFGSVEANTIDERGLLGLAFHPDFRTNRKFYVRYSAPAGPKTPSEYTHIERLAEFQTDRNRHQGRPHSERIVLDIQSPHETHNAGSVAFGPDGYLYLGMGDGGGSKLDAGHADDWYSNNGGNGQNVDENLLGSILRLDVDARDATAAYGIPDDNPLVGKAGLDEHYAWGFRNPWRISFNDGRLFVADVGEYNYEEVNIVEKGRNYGWSVREGSHCYSTDSPENPPEKCPRRTPPDVRGGEPLVGPVAEYPHVHEGESVGRAVIGGYIYENDAVPELHGTYVFGDYSQDSDPRGSLFAASPPTGSETGDETGNEDWSLEELRIDDSHTHELSSYVLGFGRDTAGELYVLTSDVLGIDPATTTGRVQKIVPVMSSHPTGTATTGRTATATETGKATAKPTQEGTASSAGGAGFGVVAALAGLAIGLARRLSPGRGD